MTKLEELIAREKAKHDLSALELCIVMSNVSRDVREKAAEQSALYEANALKALEIMAILRGKKDGESLEVKSDSLDDEWRRSDG